MVATWLTELLLDTLNRALLQQGAAGEEEEEGEPGNVGSGAGEAHERADEPSSGSSSYRQVGTPAVLVWKLLGNPPLRLS
jgi:hypothetical protein